MTREFFKVRDELPTLGVGLGLRREMFEQTLESHSEIDWLEITPEGFLGCHGKSMLRLDRAAALFRLISHGVNLSLGSTDPLNPTYLKEIKALLDTYDVPWWSDHVSFASVDNVYVNNLLPLPRTKETVAHFVERIRRAQDFVERPLLIENISFYMPNPPGTIMPESAFVTEILEGADCGMLLDVNNVYVNSVNHGFDPYEFILQLPLERVVQVHLAGHNYHENTIIDTHSEAVCDPVYDLLAFVLKRCKPKGVMLERDDNYPPFEDILAELRRIREIYDEAMQQSSVHHESEVAVQDRTSLTEAQVHDESINNSEPTDGVQDSTDGVQDSTNGVQDSTNGAPTVGKPIVLVDVEKIFSRVVLDRMERDDIVVNAESNSPAAGGFGSEHAEQLDLYGRITDAGALATMESIFPVTRKLLGEKTWTWAVAEYYHRHPPLRYVLVHVGDRFPAFLRDVGEYMPNDFVIEMADFEWMRMSMVESEVKWQDLPPPQFTQGVNLSERRPLLNPSLTIRSYGYNVVDLFDRLLVEDIEDPSDLEDLDAGCATKIAFLRNSIDQEVGIFEVAPRMDMLLTEISKCSSYADLFKRLLKRDGVENPVQQIMGFAEELTNLHAWNLIAGDLVSSPVASEQLPASH